MGILHRHHEQSPESKPDPDASLVAWAQLNPQAFTSLYDRYFSGIYGYFLSQLRDAEMAEDATSQTFLKALTALPQYRESGRFRSWLFSIAHNVVLDEVRKNHPSTSLDDATGILDTGSSPEDTACVAFDLAELDRAIARLCTADQQVLELRRSGLSGKEIASVLGISHESARKRQLRAMGRVRDALSANPEIQEALRGA